jgi:hypothetical protein
MAQRNSGYERQPKDFYPTPDWVTDCAVRALKLPLILWEPAAGKGGMVDRLRHHGFVVHGSDIDGPMFPAHDFLGTRKLPRTDIGGIFTNPPFSLAEGFIERGLDLLRNDTLQTFTLLLPAERDHGKTKTGLFRDCDLFAGQVKLMDRIVWFQRDDGEKEAPSTWHSWFHWDRRHAGEPWVRYEGKPE